LVAIVVNPLENRLLAALPDADRRRWLPSLELVEMPLGEVLYEPGDTLSAGHALRMKAETLKNEFNQPPQTA